MPADPTSPAYVTGIYAIIAAAWANADLAAEAFRTGEGIGWHEHDPRLFDGVERIFAPSYRHQLVQERITRADVLVCSRRDGGSGSPANSRPVQHLQRGRS